MDFETSKEFKDTPVKIKQRTLYRKILLTELEVEIFINSLIRELEHWKTMESCYSIWIGGCNDGKTWTEYQSQLNKCKYMISTIESMLMQHRRQIPTPEALKDAKS